MNLIATNTNKPLDFYEELAAYLFDIKLEYPIITQKERRYAKSVYFACIWDVASDCFDNLTTAETDEILNKTRNLIQHKIFGVSLEDLEKDLEEYLEEYQCNCCKE